jgi:two-component system, sensor histidine kinase and response regulator
MPGIGGFETCRRIRANPAIADTPVLFLTALGDHATTQPAIDAGGDDLLAKPFNHSELLLRARALIRLRRQARQLMAQHEALRRIAQLIVHDLRSPTTSIMVNAQLLCEAGLDPESAESASDILISARHLDCTIRDLLDLSKAEEVGLRVKLADLDLVGLVNEVASASRNIGRYKEVTIACDVRSERLVADYQLVRRMLQNLVDNAIKHAPPASQVRIAAEPTADGIQLQVSDQGEGVPEADRQRIFERYVSSGSHGLGLAFCKLAAEAHGGRIAVEPGVPQGAVFSITLPRLDSPP